MDEVKIKLKVGPLGRRAYAAVDRIARVSGWTADAVELAACGLETGDFHVGVRRRWPGLAAKLRKVANEARKPQPRRAHNDTLQA